MKIKLINFKNHNDFTSEIKQFTIVSGKNGVGKTAILDAIVFALYGRDYYGRTGSHKLIKQGEESAIVVLEIEDLVIKRIATKRGQELYINDELSPQSRIDTVFGSFEVTLSGMNPSYLLSLQPAIMRRLFMDLLDKPDLKGLFNKRFDPRLFPVFQSHSRTTAKRSLEALEMAWRENDQEVKVSLSQIELMNQELGMYKKDLMPDEVLEKSPDNTRLAASLAELEDEILKIGDIAYHTKKLESEKAELVDNVKSLISELNYSTLSEAITGLEETLKDSDIKIKKLEQTRARLGAYIDIFSEGIATGDCKVCGSELEPVGARARLEKLKSLSDKLDAEYESLTSVDYNDKLHRLIDYKTRGGEINADLERLNSLVERHLDLQKRREDIKTRLATMTNFDVKERHIQAEAKIGLLTQQIERFNARVDELRAKNKAIEPEIADTKMIVEAHSNSGIPADVIAYQTKQLEGVIGRYKSVKVETLEANRTTAGFSEVFKVYDNRGISMDRMSYGEKLKTGVALSLAIKDLSQTSLKILLVDEASVWSNFSITQVKNWVKKAKCRLIYTIVNNEKFKLESGSWGTDRVAARSKAVARKVNI